MFVCVYYVFVLSFVLTAALRRADPRSKEPYRLNIGSGKLKKRTRPKKRAVEPSREKRNENYYFMGLNAVCYGTLHL
jgi:hypothetical protein